MKKLVLFLVVALLGSRSAALAFGAEGHALVGAIADARLAGTPTAEKISVLLEGMSLSRAATLPDEIKAWDRYGVEVPGVFSLPDHPGLERQLKAFWQANPPTRKPRSTDDTEEVPAHHWFHYTDIPLRGHDAYEQGKFGRSKWDIVQMIPYSVEVLAGRIPEDNPRKITKAVAIVLLAHQVGDLHQPLHVGAEYFDRQGRPVDPDTLPPNEVYETQGGNSLFLILRQPENAPESRKRVTLHGFWDKAAAIAAIARMGEEIRKNDPSHGPDVLPSELAARLVTTPPEGWNLAASQPPALWAKAWANDVFPLAREAHDRLEYDNIQPKRDFGVAVASGFVREKEMADGRSYAEWAAEVTALQLAKAGLRLAELLHQALP